MINKALLILLFCALPLMLNAQDKIEVTIINTDSTTVSSVLRNNSLDDISNTLLLVNSEEYSPQQIAGFILHWEGEETEFVSKSVVFQNDAG
ncbi:MAG: hypothetical protein OEW67_06615 [Cyclobacteriaceae bacterium]|nr:hypothetical protein [Cyclobacteriaceae bacterium]